MTFELVDSRQFDELLPDLIERWRHNVTLVSHIKEVIPIASANRHAESAFDYRVNFISRHIR
ncbi:hypothetical protein BURPSPAST_T0264 [Burkholderia pseudomallei Pasteur 52237]|nr:hypothetical protein BURPSPAST_T0264 [Burkholderia pseudomallei Pasteur 52237]KGS01790.1 hypothetical protein X948_3002 [Burkholderia pseudomallei MSHR5608]